MPETTVYRISKVRYPVFDGTGAAIEGGRWNSPGRPIVYGSEALAGCLLEILVQAGHRQKIPGKHHCARARVPEDVAIEVVDPVILEGWDANSSVAATAHGDRWYDEMRSAVLRVPAAAARPFGTNLLLNPHHPDFGKLVIEPPVPIVWDARLFLV
jgi:RES domain-containing protein